MQYPCNAFGLLSKKQYAPNAEIRFMIKLLTDQWRILPNTAKKWKYLRFLGVCGLILKGLMQIFNAISAKNLLIQDFISYMAILLPAANGEV